MSKEIKISPELFDRKKNKTLKKPTGKQLKRELLQRLSQGSDLIQELDALTKGEEKEEKEEKEEVKEIEEKKENKYKLGIYNLLIKLKQKIFKKEEFKACKPDKNFIIIYINN